MNPTWSCYKMQHSRQLIWHMVSQCLLVSFGKDINNLIIRITWREVILFRLFISRICLSSFSWFPDTSWRFLRLWFTGHLLVHWIHLFAISLWNWEAKFWFPRGVLGFFVHISVKLGYTWWKTCYFPVFASCWLFLNGWLCLYATI